MRNPTGCLLQHPLQVYSGPMKQDVNPTDCFLTNTHNDSCVNTHQRTLSLNKMITLQRSAEQRDRPRPLSVFLFANTVMEEHTMWETESLKPEPVW